MAGGIGVGESTPRALSDALDQTRGLFLSGPAGIGKSHLADLLIAERAAAGLGQDRSCGVELVPDHRVGRGEGVFPLRFGRKARARPASEGLGLVIADVIDRRGAVVSELLPTGSLPANVEHIQSEGYDVPAGMRDAAWALAEREGRA